MARPEGEEDLSGDSTQRDLRGQVGWGLLELMVQHRHGEALLDTKLQF